jgi:hypothetical protein
MIKIKILALSVLSTAILSTTAQASMLDQVVYNVVGQASNAAGARLGDEIYYGSSRKARRKKVRHRAKRKRKHTRRAPVVQKMSDEKRIQKALASLGFYKGKIDGEVNSFETRSSIKAMNIAYGISNNASLLPQTKDTLIFLGTLFKFDRILIASGTHRKIKGKKIQTALKIHGFYHDRIDGAIGSGTRACIANYKRDMTGSVGSALDFEEEYALISTAKVKNDKNIEDSIASLKTPHQTQVNTQHTNATPVAAQQRPALKAYQPANNVKYTKPQQPNTVQAQKAVQPQVGNQVQIKQ